MKTMVKMGFLLGAWIVWAIFSAVVDPIIVNELAMSQMGNVTDSSMWIQLYSVARNYEVLWFAVFTGLLFLKEIILLIETIIEEIKK